MVDGDNRPAVLWCFDRGRRKQEGLCWNTKQYSYGLRPFCSWNPVQRRSVTHWTDRNLHCVVHNLDPINLSFWDAMQDLYTVRHSSTDPRQDTCTYVVFYVQYKYTVQIQRLPLDNISYSRSCRSRTNLHSKIKNLILPPRVSVTSLIYSQSVHAHNNPWVPEGYQSCWFFSNCRKAPKKIEGTPSATSALALPQRVLGELCLGIVWDRPYVECCKVWFTHRLI